LSIFSGKSSEEIAKALVENVNTTDVQLCLDGNSKCLEKIIKKGYHRTRKWKLRVNSEGTQKFKTYIKVGPTPQDLWIGVAAVAAIIILRIIFEIIYY